MRKEEKEGVREEEEEEEERSERKTKKLGRQTSRFVGRAIDVRRPSHFVSFRPPRIEMSLAYADALTYREDLGGQLGDPEIFEDRASAAAKADLLAAAMLSSTSATSSPSSSHSAPSSGRGVVVFTGAGISVSCGIPDFRGPNGVWTRQKKNLGPPPLARGVSFATARPSLTHLALAHLVRAGIVTRVVSQNVDGLHLRSGIAPDRLFELHGNCFVEACRGCGARHERDFETGTVGFKATGRRCERCVLGGSSNGVGVGGGGEGEGGGEGNK